MSFRFLEYPAEDLETRFVEVYGWDGSEGQWEFGYRKCEFFLCFDYFPRGSSFLIF